MVNFLNAELLAPDERLQTGAESERRAYVLAHVAAAASTDEHARPDMVLASVVDSLRSLGFEGSEIGLLQEDEQHSTRWSTPEACLRGTPRGA